MKKTISKKTATKKKKQPARNAAKRQSHRQIDLVVGGTSIVGAKLIRKLVEMGHEVRAVMVEKPTDVRWSNLPAGAIPYSIDLRLNNNEERRQLEAACTGTTTIYHIAAATMREDFSIDDYININVVGTENLLQACADANKGTEMRFVYLSTMGVYGNERKDETLTEDSTAAPVKPYTETKLMAEQVIKAFADANRNMKYTILRCATMYGPGYNRGSFRLFKYIKEEKLRYVGNGNNHVTLVHVDDVVDAMLLAAQKETAMNQIYNLTDGHNYTVKELVEYSASLLHAPVPHKSLNRVIAHVTHRIVGLDKEELEFLMVDRKASIEKIKRELGFRPKRSVQTEGPSVLKEYITGTR